MASILHRSARTTPRIRAELKVAKAQAGSSPANTASTAKPS
jgi:hypothetical protein